MGAHAGEGSADLAVDGVDGRAERGGDGFEREPASGAHLDEKPVMLVEVFQAASELSDEIELCPLGRVDPIVPISRIDVTRSADRFVRRRRWCGRLRRLALIDMQPLSLGSPPLGLEHVQCGGVNRAGHPGIELPAGVGASGGRAYRAEERIMRDVERETLVATGDASGERNGAGKPEVIERFKGRMIATGEGGGDWTGRRGVDRGT